MRGSAVGALPSLRKETYDLVAQVPEGMVTTYGEVAKALGDIVASRFVGLAMSENDDTVRVPCRRVVRSDGHVGGYTGGGPSRKTALLRKEGIRISRGRVQDLEKVLFNDFRTRHPLRALRARQRSLRKQVSLKDAIRDIERVAGIDIAYAGDRTFAAMVLLDYKTGKVLSSTVEEGVARFPYVPTYLAYREIPVVIPLTECVDKQTVVLYDGNGIMHPERFGIASHFGVLSGLSTIGVAKKHLFGRVGGDSRSLVQPVRDEGGLLGHCLRRTAGGRPVYVSAGHGISPTLALEVSRRLLVHRVPEPTRLAHMAAEAARRSRTNK